MKFIVLTVTKYKDYDAIISGINDEKGLIEFKALGVYRPNNKNKIILNPLTVCDITFTNQNQKYDILKEVSTILSPYGLSDSLEKLSSIQRIAKLTKMGLQDEEFVDFYDTLFKTIQSLQRNDQPYLTLISYISTFLKKVGYAFEMNHCVRCGSKNGIVVFSFDEGGFICKDCLSSEDSYSHFTTQQILLLRFLYLFSEEYNFKKVNYNEEDCITILNSYICFINDQLGIDLDFELLK